MAAYAHGRSQPISGTTETLSDEQLAEQLYQATKDGDIDQVTTVLKQGANPNNTLYWRDEWVFPKLPPLHHACWKGNLQLAKVLVTSSGAITNRGDRNYNQTPLHWACESGDIDTVMYLINELHCDVDVMDDLNQTILHKACESGNKATVQYLVEVVKCDVDVRNEVNQTILHRACFSGNKATVQYLVEVVKCDVDVRGQFKRTILHLACRGGNKATVQYLVEVVKCDVDVKDQFNKTILHLACLGGNKATVQYLVEVVKCDVDVRNQLKETILHCACESGNKATVQYLVEVVKCDVDVTDVDGETPFDIAKRHYKTELIDYFQSFQKSSQLAPQSSSGPPHTDHNTQKESQTAPQSSSKPLSGHEHEMANSPTGYTVEPPVINKHPLNKTAAEGKTVTFSIKAQGTNLKYEWWSNETILKEDDHYSNVSTPHLSITNAGIMHSGQYYCVVSNDGGRVASNHTQLVIMPKGTPLTQADMEAIDKLLKDNGSNLTFEDLVVGIEVLDSDGSGDVSATLETVQQSLRQKGFNDLAKNLRKKLNETLEEQQRYVRRLQDLMTDENTVQIRYLKLFLVGPPFVGKTTTLNRLLKEILNLQSAGDKGNVSSTLLANCTQVLAFVQDSEADWLASKNIDDEARLLFSYLYSQEASTSSSSESSNPVESSDPAPQDLKATKAQPIPKNRKRKKPVTTQNPKKRKLTGSPRSVRRKTKDYKKIFERLENVIKKGNYSSELFRLLGNTLLNINDIGGQPGFLEMLPALIKGPAMYLLFFNLGEPLDVPYRILFSRDDTTITPFEAMHTVEETLSQVLSAIASVHCTTDPTLFHVEGASEFIEKVKKFQSVCPAATVIGTHKDKLKGDVEGQIKAKHKALKKITDKFDKIVVNPDKESAFFAVDNYEGTEQSDLAPIRTHLHGLLSTHFREASLPVRPAWFLFGIILRKEFCIATMEDCLEIGEQLGMKDKEEVEFCLRYLHEYVGALMYYPSVPGDKDRWFKNHVICTPQVVFDSISQLIVASLRTLHSDGPCLEADRKEWIMMGQFSLQAIEKYCSSEKIVEKLENLELIPANMLVLLLEDTNLLSLIKQNSDDVKNEDQRYLLPAVLPCATQEELTQPPQPDDNNPAPVYIAFESGYAPMGAFCGLMAHLVSKGPDGILGLTWELEEQGIKRNQISFYVDSVHTVTLLTHEVSFEFRVKRNDENLSLHDLCSYVLSAIFSVIKQLYESLTLKLAFECTCEQHQHSTARDLSNLCILAEGSRSRFLCGRKPVELKEEQFVWIGKHTPLGSHVSLEVLQFATLSAFSFHWSKEGTRRPVPTCEPNVVEISSVSKEHFGQYKCEVRKQGKLHFTVLRVLQKQTQSSVQPSETSVPVTHALSGYPMMNPSAQPLPQRYSEHALMNPPAQPLPHRSSEHALMNPPAQPLPQRSSEHALMNPPAQPLPQRPSEHALTNPPAQPLPQRSIEHALMIPPAQPLPQRSSEHALTNPPMGHSPQTRPAMVSPYSQYPYGIPGSQSAGVNPRRQFSPSGSQSQIGTYSHAGPEGFQPQFNPYGTLPGPHAQFAATSASNYHPTNVVPGSHHRQPQLTGAPPWNITSAGPTSGPPPHGDRPSTVDGDGSSATNSHSPLQQTSHHQGPDLKFSIDMSCDQLCVWLEQKRVTGNDLQVFKDQNVDGDTFSTLPTDKNELNTVLDCTLTLGGSNKLCRLIQQLHKASSSSSDQTSSHQDATNQPTHADYPDQATPLKLNTHLQSVYTAVYEARSKWKNIGRSLRVSEGTIASIHHSDDGECLHAVLTSWIQTGDAVIQDLLQALENITVGREDIAIKIRQREGEDRTSVGL